MKTAIDVIVYLMKTFDQMIKEEVDKEFEMLYDENVTVGELSAQKEKANALGKAKAVVVQYAENELGISLDTIYSMIKGEDEC